MYLTGVGHDVGDVLQGVHRLGAVRTLLGDFCVIGHDERKVLAVDDMPMRHVDLGIVEAHQAHTYIKEVNDTHVYPGHRVEHAFNVRQRKAKA